MTGCGRFSLIGTDAGKAGVYPLRCKRWGCPICGPRKMKATVARVMRGMHAPGTYRFFTLTSPGTEGRDLSYAEFSARWKRFHLALVRQWGHIEYIGVVEPQRRGAAHIHVVYRGVYIPQAWLSMAAKRARFGPIAHIKLAPRSIATYLAKYLTKELRDPKVAPPRYFRRVRWSKGWCEWTRAERERKWSSWWIADAVPVHAAISAARRGYDVVDVNADDWAAGFHPKRFVRWFRSLRDAGQAPRPVGLAW